MRYALTAVLAVLFIIGLVEPGPPTPHNRDRTAFYNDSVANYNAFRAG